MVIRFMNQVFEQALTITPSISDADGQLGYFNAFGVCMDIAAIHAQMLGIGLYEMASRDLFWLTVRTQLLFFDRPRMMECVKICTWPDSPGKLRGNRSYQICRGDTILISGKTEWAVTNLSTKQLVPMEGVYPPELVFSMPSASCLPYARIQDDFDDCEPYESYTVRSTDIDVGGHMNNTAYVRILLASLSSHAVRDLNIGRMDIAFRSPCYENDVLFLQRHENGKCTDFRIAREGVTVALARIEQK